MKKLVFAVIAAFLVNLSFTSCGSSSPEDELISCAEEMLSTMKSTHINSADDVEALRKKMKAFQEKIKKTSEDMKKKEEGMNEEERKKYNEKYRDKGIELLAEVYCEGMRLKEEAENAGVDFDGFDF